MTSVCGISVDPRDPARAWQALRTHLRREPLPHAGARPDGPHLRVVCISDTHGHPIRADDVPAGDILIHAGDFTHTGTPEELSSFVTQLGRLPHRHKVVIAGNHDLTLDQAGYETQWRRFHKQGPYSPDSCRRILENAHNISYLLNSGIEISGLRCWGSPVQPTFFQWAFNQDRGAEIQATWAMIPTSVDILVTHGPPLGYGDRTIQGHHVGCVDLLARVHAVRPRLHIFGHIHEEPGAWTDGQTIFVNATHCDVYEQPRYAPVVVDLPLPALGGSQHRQP